MLRAGDSWNWERAFPDYPSGEYRLKYILNSAAHRFLIDGTISNPPITADADGQGFIVAAPPSLTGTCAADTYQLIAVLIGITGTAAEGEQVTLPIQDVEVAPNLAAASGPVDTRSFVKKRLDMIEAAMAGDTRPDVLEYSINGRQLRKIPPLELEALRNQYERRYITEQRARGEYAPRKTVLGFRFK